MSDTSIFIWLIAVAVGVLGCIPWLIVSAAKKRWRSLGIQIAAPVLLFAALLLVTRLIDHAGYRSYLNNVYDASVVLGPPVFEYNSERSFNGDGYSFEVYKLPDSVRSRLQAPDGRLFADFPKRPTYRDHWETKHWREAPLDPAFSEDLSFALSSYDESKATGLTEHFDNIRSSITRNGTFYSCFKYDPGDYPGNIDLFIVDLHAGRIYHINHNT
ncbi:hypothetical protein RISK_000552 [Rhodopirellula islandica]|uniref:Uncharacterized protein n=1 Tax=Rhodopirellula islandica TaxID=595434 RepID=A0A0J1EPR7_RHOIS|nr:hypothetical protein [Rhodopirellula islandica]KLU07474.1 hypothetical protein RISK_000552 [Rhodopirellula islandica]